MRQEGNNQGSTCGDPPPHGSTTAEVRHTHGRARSKEGCERPRSDCSTKVAWRLATPGGSTLWPRRRARHLRSFDDKFGE